MSEDDKTDAAKPAPTWPRVVTLKYPIDFGSQHITTLELRRGRMGDLKGIKLGATVATSDLLLLASRLSGQPVNVIELLDAEDAGEVMDVVLDFFARCLSTGLMPSR